VVDSLLGTGNNRPITGQLAALLDAVQDAITLGGHSVVAVDCPSGVNSDSGAVDPHTLPAQSTVTFGYPKEGHYIFPAPKYMGRYTIADIGIPNQFADDLTTFLLEPAVVQTWLPNRDSNSHKGTFGKVMLAVGSFHYPGAAYLACAAAGRSGAGLVTGAIPRPLWEMVAGKLAEPTWLPLPASSEIEGGVLQPEAASLLIEGLAGYRALVVGCGLGNHSSSQQFMQQLFQQSKRLPATVIDADGLNCLAQWSEWVEHLPNQVVLTPHAAEMARLCNLSTADVVQNRWALAREKAAEWQAVVLVKGPYTGIIGGLLAQGVPTFEAACLGAWIHVHAGLLCQQEIGPSGVVASDLLPRLPKSMNQLRDG